MKPITHSKGVTLSCASKLLQYFRSLFFVVFVCFFAQSTKMDFENPLAYLFGGPFVLGSEYSPLTKLR